MIKLLSRCSLGVGALLASAVAIADERPLEVYNQGALARAFELPVLGNSHVVADGASFTEFRYDLTTEYHASGDAAESVILDGETDLLTLAFRRGIGHGLELTAEIPVMVQGGGFLDQPVESWHRFFGLPNGGREFAPRNRYLYEYQRNGQDLLDVHRSGADVGDVRVGLGWQALDGLAVRGELKLPSGVESHLSGGNPGGALWTDWALPFSRDSIFNAYLSAGAAYNGRTDILEDMQNRWVPFAGAGVGVRVFDKLSVLGQLYFHEALYNGDLDPFRNALQLAMGLRYHVDRDFGIDLGFQEDLITSSSPDFSIHLALNWSGGRV